MADGGLLVSTVAHVCQHVVSGGSLRSLGGPVPGGFHTRLLDIEKNPSYKPGVQ